MKTSEPKPTKEEILAKHGYKCAIDVKDKDKFIEAFVNPLLEAMDEWAEIYHKEKLREELIKFAEWYDGDIIPKELIVDKYLKTKG